MQTLNQLGAAGWQALQVGAGDAARVAAGDEAASTSAKGTP